MTAHLTLDEAEGHADAPRIAKSKHATSLKVLRDRLASCRRKIEHWQNGAEGDSWYAKYVRSRIASERVKEADLMAAIAQREREAQATP